MNYDKDLVVILAPTLRGLAEFDETGSQTDFPEAVSGVGFVSFVYP